ncbi:MAG: cobaltochelatase subunit CobN [Acidobacteria bacterium]|nr:cobaltochelatase subunit CobN [Acidobacteriota bacterium]
MKITVLYVGASLLAPLKKAEADIARLYKLNLQVAAHNCGASFTEQEWLAAKCDIEASAIVFIIHVTDDDNARRIKSALDKSLHHHALDNASQAFAPSNRLEQTVIAFNCMPDLMRLTRMGKLDFNALMKSRNAEVESKEASGQNLVRKLGAWMSDTFKGRKTNNTEFENRHAKTSANASHQTSATARRSPTNHGQYVKFINRLPLLLKFIPSAGKLGDIKHYLYLFCYFLQPTPNNIRSMLLYAIKYYAGEKGRQGEGETGRQGGRESLVIEKLFKQIKIDAPEIMPAVGIYHPDSAKLFATFEAYQKWYEAKRRKKLERDHTIGLLLMRPQIISDARQHYDYLIRAIEAEGLSVIPAISTFMDNRDACRQFFIEPETSKKAKGQRLDETAKGKRFDEKAKGKRQITKGKNAEVASHQSDSRNKESREEGIANQSPHLPVSPSPCLPVSLSPSRSRVSQIVSLTGFSFVGGPAMNDNEAAVEFFKELKVPFRSMVSLDVQTLENWQQSKLGINPVQAAMQVALPELDGASEAFVFGGLSQQSHQPVALEERCRRIARRLAKWQRLQTATAAEKRLAFLLFCFPPNKGNLGTAADLDVFPSLLEILRQLKSAGYRLNFPDDAKQLRDLILDGNADEFGSLANVAYRMSVDEYRRLCPYVADIEKEWGKAPGNINSNGREVLISGIVLDNIFVGVQPTFGYEGDPMRMLASESGAPHHGFMGLYTYVEKIFNADAVIHVGTHGALEFMPGKQVGLSSACWPDRLIGELPNLYLYSVNNPSEGTIAKRRSYAELISYLTPPIENAGLYKELIAMKELLTAYRHATTESEREQLFFAIEEKAHSLNL